MRENFQIREKKHLDWVVGSGVFFFLKVKDSKFSTFFLILVGWVLV